MGMVGILLKVARELSVSDYVLLICCALVAFIYRALHFHFLEQLRGGLRGQRVQLVYNSASSLASQILPQCRILNGRYMPTLWLCSSHLQTAFLHFFGRPPQFDYHRKLYRTPDGGTIALDWLFPKSGMKHGNAVTSSDHECSKDTRIAVVIPGLTSDSADAYVKHIVYNLAASGWRVVVANHRGLGGVSITSNQFYNAGWTEDLRRIINNLHRSNPKAQIFAVGTSIGANILVKYLGEEREHTPLGGAAAICCPWDLLVCSRFIAREWIQRFYDKILAFGLRSYAAVHQAAFSQMADWDLIRKCSTVREFDHHCTCVVSKYETVDTYYRQNSSAAYVQSISIPLLCISSLDDPVCTKEAIPWDECRVNANVMLAITRHGGHLSFFEGLTAHSIWWVRATTEFFENLSASSVFHVPPQSLIESSGRHFSLENLTDGSPYLNVSENGLIASEAIEKEEASDFPELLTKEDGQTNTAIPDEDPSSRQNFEPISVSTLQERVSSKGSLGLGTPEGAKSYRESSEFTSERTEDSHGSTLKVSLHSFSQLLSLEFTLLQLLEQVRLCKHANHTTAIATEGNMLNKRAPIHSHTRLHAETHKISNNRQDITIAPHSNSKSDVLLAEGTKVIAKQNRRTLWFLAYIAIITTWPLIGSVLFLRGKGRLRSIFLKFAANKVRAQ
ncbi:hypothetical protein KP509_32G070600 [Ceratopteris richardii]|uniref:AB hydrolase-1 domain-containing protein n=1 Tax=Ceratopteris richardii TaxID=49495 RepID=A0A8T2QW24_CERRI|nr:hypothetical protein KP509_32G070600 [Ceratopteris richardii]